jgi:peptide/nickel transport system ATP-binding protein
MANLEHADTATPDREPLLEVSGLSVSYLTRRGEVRAVDDVSLTLRRGEIVGLVGESGCGKTSLALALIRLLPPLGRIDAGQIRLDGKDLAGLSSSAMRRYRWTDIAMVFQGAADAWNPVHTIEKQIEESMRAHGRGPARRQARATIGAMLERVGLPADTLLRYPHELSTGMLQRAALAMALSCEPRLLIADEPTTAIDVISQNLLLEQLEAVRDELGTTILYISHDIAAVAEISDRMALMYAGRMAEVGPTTRLFRRPRHPYTAGLLDSVPRLRGPLRELTGIDGEPPDLFAPPPGCRFRPRCPIAGDACAEQPPLEEVGEDHLSACWHQDRVPPRDVTASGA